MTTSQPTSPAKAHEGGVHPPAISRPGRRGLRSRIGGRLSPLRDLLGRYAALMSWLLADSVGRFKYRFVLIVISGLAGLGLQVLAFLALGLYAVHFAEGTTVALGEWVIEPRESLAALITVGAIVCAALIAASVLHYVSQVGTIALGRRYEQFCAERALGIVGTLSQKDEAGEDHVQEDDAADDDEDGAMDGRTHMRACKADARLAGRCLRIITSAFAPLVMAVAAFAALFWLHAALTLIVVATGTVLMFIQFRFSRAASRCSIAHEEHSKQAAGEFRQAMSGGDEPDAALRAERAVRSPIVQRYLDSFEGRLRALAGSRFASQLFAAPTITIVLVVLGAEIIQEGGGWERLLVYVIALRTAVAGVEAGFLRLTSINRFYAQMRRYFLFLQNPRAAT